MSYPLGYLREVIAHDTCFPACGIRIFEFHQQVVVLTKMMASNISWVNAIPLGYLRKVQSPRYILSLKK
jgi:hypothetical protein